MSTIANNINTYADMTAYNADLNKDYPNVSYISGTDEVKMYEYDPVYVVCKYNVTTTESATKLLGNSSVVSTILKQYIDGVEQQSVQTDYTFDTTGEHIVKYKLNGTATPNNMFAYANQLISLTIPDNVTNIGYDLLTNGDTNPKGGVNHIVIGSGVTTIARNPELPKQILGESATRRCQTIIVDSHNTVYDSRNNCNAIIETATNKLLAGSSNTVIPNSVTSIDNYAFSCTYLLTDITIPSSVTSIGEYAFYKSYLSSVTIQEGVTTIGKSAFSSCRYLTNVTLPSTITSIGQYAFSYSLSGTQPLTSVTILATTPPTLGTQVFNGQSRLTTIYVPAESVETYKAASRWSTYASKIQAIPTT